MPFGGWGGGWGLHQGMCLKMQGQLLMVSDEVKESYNLGSEFIPHQGTVEQIS